MPDKLDKHTGLITPDWPAPKNIVALNTTRSSFNNSHAHCALEGYEAFNLALHVGDKSERVLQNRQHLSAHLNIQEKHIAWLEQIHGTRIVEAQNACEQQALQADASICQQADRACVVMTADCLPVLFCNIDSDTQPQQVAAVHAGWRGLASGILAKTLAQFPDPAQVIAWMGPAISQGHFEVGQEVYEAFYQQNPENIRAFAAARSSLTNQPKWFASLTELARIELQGAGINAVYGGEWCTVSDSSLFYSYRRDGSQSGRMASLIMIH